LFLGIPEGQINMVQLYSHGEMTMFKCYVPTSTYATYTIWQYEMCVF